jgi:hypothetical protein
VVDVLQRRGAQGLCIVQLCEHQQVQHVLDVQAALQVLCTQIAQTGDFVLLCYSEQLQCMLVQRRLCHGVAVQVPDKDPDGVGDVVIDHDRVGL